MCAAVLRHLRSLRLMRRDGGFIHDLLGEAEVCPTFAFSCHSCRGLLDKVNYDCFPMLIPLTFSSPLSDRMNACISSPS